MYVLSWRLYLVLKEHRSELLKYHASAKNWMCGLSCRFVSLINIMSESGASIINILMCMISIFTEPPVCHPNSTVTMKDSTITLRCNVTGTPTPNITWYRAKGIVDSTDGKVMVKNEHCENTTYHCHAKNDAGYANCSVLTVRGMYIHAFY